MDWEALGSPRNTQSEWGTDSPWNEGGGFWKFPHDAWTLFASFPLGVEGPAIAGLQTAFQHPHL